MWKTFYRSLKHEKSDQADNQDRNNNSRREEKSDLDKKLKTLDRFVKDYRTSPISGFVNGLKKDIAPVKNAISSEVSSGFVEGGNCRYKQTKRVMFGRATLNHLFHKTYAISIIMRTAKIARDLFFESYDS